LDLVVVSFWYSAETENSIPVCSSELSVS